MTARCRRRLLAFTETSPQFLPKSDKPILKRDQEQPLQPGEDVALATHNPGKLAEFARLLAPHGVTVKSASDLHLPEPEETEVTFSGNAALKARAAAEASGLAALADDSGLAVAGLDGAPGVYSARWAGSERDFSAAMARVRTELEARGVTDFSAAFVCVLAFTRPGWTAPALFEGRVEGRLVFPPRGAGGFGYDPIFIPHGADRTFAEMEPAEKQTFSHRARAFQAFAGAVLKAAATPSP